MIIFADTSFYVELGYTHDAFHDSALAFAGNYEGKYLTTEYVLVELGNHFCSMERRVIFWRLYGYLREHPETELVAASPELTRDGIDLYLSRTDKNWSLTDCISFSLMRRLNVTQAATTDHHFEQAGFERLIKPIRK